MTSLAPAAKFLKFIRFSHTIFAMPFALGALWVAADGLPELRVFALVVAALVFARTAAMTFNRIVDWEIDRKNPRTEGRHRLMGKRGAMAACALSSVLFVAASAMINMTCLILSPVALLLVFFYSFTKRFTHAAQFFLGLALAAAPAGAWIAVTGGLDLAVLVLCLGVMLWVAGFDIIYATQDVEFDRAEGLHSLVVSLGIPRALALAQILHAGLWLCLLGFGWLAGLGGIYFFSLLPILGLLIYEHRVAKSLDLDAINVAFFRTNAWIGGIFAIATLFDRLV